jgi:CubicO group peptidase (beta-lactamase class C family)
VELKLEGELDEVGLDASRIGRIPAFFDDLVAAGRLSGWLTTINRGGKLVWVGRGGHRDRERALNVTDDTIWRLFSMTKPITAVAALMLYEEGKFDLNDEVGRWISEFKEPRVYVEGPAIAMTTRPASEPVRVHHLFTHTAGLTYGFQSVSPVDAYYRSMGYDELSWKFPEGADLASAVHDWCSAPLLFDPGSAWNYSIGLEILGRLIEIWSGQRLDHFITERILKPLGMTDTDWYCPPEKEDRLAMLYVNFNGSALPVEEIGREFLKEPTLFLGGGGLVSTAGDFQKFMSMMLGRGSLNGASLLAPRTIEMMTRNHLPANATIGDLGRGVFSNDGQVGNGYGLGVAVTVDQVRNRSLMTEGSYFWGGAASTTFWVDPKEELSVAFYAQLLPSTSHTWRRTLHQLVYSSML